MSRTWGGLTQKVRLNNEQMAMLRYLRGKWNSQDRPEEGWRDFTVASDEVITACGFDPDSKMACHRWHTLAAKMRKLILQAVDNMMTLPWDKDDPDSPTIYEHYRREKKMDDDGIWRKLIKNITGLGYFPLWADPFTPRYDHMTNQPIYPPYQLFDLDSFLDLKDGYREGIISRIKTEVEVQRALKRIVPDALATRQRKVLNSGVDEVFKILPIVQCPLCPKKFRGNEKWQEHMARRHTLPAQS